MMTSTLHERQTRDGDNTVDDRGTTQNEAVTILRNLRDHGFASSNEQLARALGRSPQQVEGWLAGSEQVDDDAVIKARGIAREREVATDANSEE